MDFVTVRTEVQGPARSNSVAGRARPTDASGLGRPASMTGRYRFSRIATVAPGRWLNAPFMGIQHSGGNGARVSVVVQGGSR